LPRRRLLGTVEKGGRSALPRARTSPRSATIKDSTGQRCPAEGRSALTDPALGSPRMWRGAAASGRLRLLADRGSVGEHGPMGKQGLPSERRCAVDLFRLPTGSAPACRPGRARVHAGDIARLSLRPKATRSKGRVPASGGAHGRPGAADPAPRAPEPIRSGACRSPSAPGPPPDRATPRAPASAAALSLV
jgi:hypothetical protein